MSFSRRLLVLLPLLATAPALAQTTATGRPAVSGTTSATSGGQNAVTRPNTDHVPDGKSAHTDAVANVRLEKGANSFTKGEVRRRLEKAGYRDVRDLKKDGDGIWRASATLDGKPASIGFDFKGNVAAQ